MPELGKYAVYVLGSYGVTLVLLLGIVWVSLVQSRRAKARLQGIEQTNG